MARVPNIGITRKAYEALAQEYRNRWSVGLRAVAPDGRVVFHDPGSSQPSSPAGKLARSEAISEALRWGEPTVAFCFPDRLIWAIPIMHNAEVLGGLLVETQETTVFPDASGQAALDIRSACEDLRRIAQRENLTNIALLDAHRAEYHREQQRAEAIHLIKLAPPANIREMYLRDEPALLAAIRKDDRPQAREILNKLLTAIYQQAGTRLDLTKSFFMELVVMMCRTAIEAGGNSEELLGTNFVSISQLATIQSDEALAPWLHQMLERIMDAIQTHRRRPADRIAAEALHYMSEHFAELITRDEVAQAVGASPSHFSRLFKAQVGRSFTNVLNQIRIDRASQALVRTDKPLVLIALECGFSDQSYFTKVFRRHAGISPLKYRKNRAMTE